ncbi:MAG: hypothetical protein V7L23_18600 [Nostoc sp.]|uniref:hypothetical protein n=1 Tax=Nostoc sp. TaxID=1180 RepID=UPI002FF35EC1
MSDKAKRAIIIISGIEVKGFQLPDGSYIVSQSQAGKTVDKDRKSMFRFLGSATFKALHGEGYECSNTPIDKDWLGRGNKSKAKAITIDVLFNYWLDQAFKGNVKAQALVRACGQETLQRRFDSAFGIVKTEAQYEQQTISAYDEYRKSRELLRTSHNGLVNACSRFKFNCAMVHDAITMAVCGKTAAQLRELEVIEGSTVIGLNHIDSAKTLVMIAKVKLAFSGYRSGTWTQRVARALRETSISE